MKKRGLDYGLTALGMLLVGIGFFFVKTQPEPQGIMRQLPYLCIGIGCGVFGHFIGNIITRISMKHHPDVQKQMEINQNDERNIAISNRSKAKAYDRMLVVFGALMIVFALMNVTLTAVLLLVLAYLFIVGSSIYYRYKYEKEM
jgi:hypothetical protein